MAIRTLLAAIILSCAPHTENGLEANVEQQLVVNTAPQHYVVQMTQWDGEQQLRYLANTSKIEESWIYVQVQGQGTWYETGLDEQPGSVSYDKQVVRAAIKQFKDSALQKITTYHIHPTPSGLENKSSPSFPSGKDMRNMDRISEEIVFEENGVEMLRQYDARVVDINGVYIVAFDFENYGTKSDEEREEELHSVYRTKDSKCSGIFPLEKNKRNDALAITCSRRFAERLDETAQYTAAFYSWAEIDVWRRKANNKL